RRAPGSVAGRLPHPVLHRGTIGRDTHRSGAGTGLGQTPHSAVGLHRGNDVGARSSFDGSAGGDGTTCHRVRRLCRCPSGGRRPQTRLRTRGPYPFGFGPAARRAADPTSVRASCDGGTYSTTGRERRLPRSANSADLSAIPRSMASTVSSPCSSAYLRTSWEIFMEQNFGPHMEQKWAVLAGSAGRVSSWK